MQSVRKELLTIVCTEHDVENNAKKRERDKPVKIITKSISLHTNSMN